MSTPLTREMILQVDDLERKEVEVEQWGGHLYVRALSGNELARLQKHNKGEKATFDENLDFTARLLVATVVSADGEQLLTEADIAALREKNFGLQQMLVKESMKINGLDDKAVEGAEKN